MTGKNEPSVFLKVEGLKTYFDTDRGVAKAVDGIDFEILGGETLGVVGESGCGKSMTALSIMRLFPSPPGRIAGGRIWFKGRELRRLHFGAERPGSGFRALHDVYGDADTNGQAARHLPAFDFAFVQ